MQSHYAMINGRKILVPSELKEEVSTAQIEIAKLGMDAHEARVCLILDVSASMQGDHQFFSHPVHGNRVQKLINKALALAFLFDDNQQVEVFPFGDKVFGDEVKNQGFQPIVIDKNNYTTSTDRILRLTNGYRQATYYGDPVKAVRQFYFQDQGYRQEPKPSDETPVFAIFVTDGEPNGKEDEAMREFASASYLPIFFKFIALRGTNHSQRFTFLECIDNSQLRKATYGVDNFYMDNSNFVLLNDPAELTMEALIREYRPWLADAFEQKLLLNNPGIGAIKVNSEGRTVKLFNPPPPLPPTKKAAHANKGCLIC
jgi:hypothetical protein